MKTLLTLVAALLVGGLSSPVAAVSEAAAKLEIPDVAVVDQDGRPLRFYSDLIRGKTVAVNFVFTTCTTVCPPMGANFARLQKLLVERGGSDVSLISVSIDPATDTPRRMKEWGAKFGAGPGWTLVTGDRAVVTQLLKALGVFNRDKADHSPLVLIGNDRTGHWTRTYGLTPPAKLAELIAQATRNDVARGGAQVSTQGQMSAAHHYFGDVKLINQDGKEMRLYSDLLAGKAVVINVVFTTCASACPAMSAAFAKIQDHLGDRLGKDVSLISISVDPLVDTPAKLKEYAARFNARPGWYFLTGSQANVEEALKKLGQYVENKEDHMNLFLIGNERTGLWKKAFGLSFPQQLFPIIDSVIDDAGSQE